MMHAILVFGPQNDLMLVKSNHLFRRKVISYAKANGLLSASSSSSSSCSCNSSPGCCASPKGSCQAAATRLRRRQRRVRPVSATYRRSANTSDRRLADHFSDSSERYLEILMLLLTPYVASLRLSSDLASERSRQLNSAQMDPTQLHSSPNRVPPTTLQQQQQQQQHEDLLSKFITSIDLNLECGESSSDQNVHSSTELSPRQFATIRMPIECLQDCQIVYCHMYGFIFVYMHELELVSSFKLRQLQKRIDLFARLCLLLLGPSMGPSPRVASSRAGPGSALTRAFDVWTDEQFELEFLLEAQERLIIDKQIEQHCSSSLQKISLHLRASARKLKLLETHQHALLFSHTKLVSRFSCRNSQSLNQDDLILLLLLLRSYNLSFQMSESTQCGQQSLEPIAISHRFVAEPSIVSPVAFQPTAWISQNTTDKRNIETKMAKIDKAERANSLTRSQTTGHLRDEEPLETPRYCYASNYATSKQTYRINPGKCAHKRRRFTRATLSKPIGDIHNDTPNGPKAFPDQLLVFLASSSGLTSGDRLRVPHLVRLITLSPGITLMLISEISTSLLCLQFHKLLRMVFEMAKRSGRIKLAQLTRVNDCVAAIKSYFLGRNFEEADSSGNEPKKSNSRGLAAISSMFNKYLGVGTSQGQADGDQVTIEQTNVYATLDANSQRACRQLLAKLEELVSSNVHTFMMQTFSNKKSTKQRTTNSCQDHRREALLSSVSLSLRDAVEIFITEPQLRLLQATNDNLTDSDVQRRVQLAELFDEVKLLARDDLGDYLDYLATKSSCNVTLGAPLTHDMSALRAFAYIDRNKQALVQAPVLQRTGPSGGQSLLESANLLGESPEHWADLLLNATVSSQGHSSGLAGESDVSSSLNEASDNELDSPPSEYCRTDYEAESEASLADETEDDALSVTRESRKAPTTSASSTAIGHRRSASVSNPTPSSWLLATSNDLVSPKQACSSAASSVGSSSQLATSCDLGALVGTLSGRQQSSAVHEPRCMEKSARAQQHFTKTDRLIDMLEPRAANSSGGRQLDDKLMSNFACFIYNRLADGRAGSYTCNDGTYVYSYFLWFRRNSGTIVKPSQTGQALAQAWLARDQSLPSLVCGNFFDELSRRLFADLLVDKGGPVTRQTKSNERQLLRVSCRITEVDASAPERPIRHRLAHLIEQQEEEDDDDMEPDGGLHLGGSDFAGLFVKHSDARHQHKTRIQMIKTTKGAQDDSSASCISHDRPNQSHLDQLKRQRQINCYELFCIHEAGLLVHRNQAAIEAERLAGRLSNLLRWGSVWP